MTPPPLSAREGEESVTRSGVAVDEPSRDTPEPTGARKTRPVKNLVPGDLYGTLLTTARSRS